MRRISGIFFFFVLSLIIEGACAWWAAAARMAEPIILSFGAAFVAFGINNQPSHDVQSFDVKGWFKSKFAMKDAETEYKEIKKFMQKHPEIFDAEEREMFNKETDEYFQNSDKERESEEEQKQEIKDFLKDKKENTTMNFQTYGSNEEENKELSGFMDRLNKANE